MTTYRQYPYTKTAAPTVNDDTGDGYMVGDVWLDTTNKKIYQVIDVTAGAAVWVEMVGVTQTQTLTNKTLTSPTINSGTLVTPTIASFVNATHNHTSAATGGALVTGFPLYLNSSGLSPVDATTYYFGAPTLAVPTTTANVRKRYIPVAGTITRADITVYNNTGTVGSNETSSIYVRLNNTTDTLLTSSLTANAASQSAVFFNVTGLSVAVAVGDYVEAKWITPTWATNPTLVWVEVVLYIS